MKRKRASLFTTSILMIAAVIFSFSGINIINNKAELTGKTEFTTTEAPLIVCYIDVGQGDAVFVKCGGSTMLIDTGTSEYADTVVNLIEAYKTEKIDVLIGTHPHEDHIGSMDNVIKKYEIGVIYMPEVTATTQTFKDVVNAVINKGLYVRKPVPGAGFKLGDAECTFFAPNSGFYDGLNNYSIVLKLVYGGTSFLFTGDAGVISEREMIDSKYDLKTDVLKIGHHGSNDSTSGDFLDIVDPGYAVIMCGKDNDYGHPHAETTAKLIKKGIRIYRTDENGTITCTSDGENIVFMN